MAYSTTASTAYQPLTTRKEGLFARMIRLWVEHHHRMIEAGIRQF